MALMAAAGEITPMPDFAVFADTQAEPESVYRWLDWLEPRLPFPVHRITYGSLEAVEQKLVRSGRSGNLYRPSRIPVFLSNGGMGIRRCTREYKIDPIRRAVVKLAKIPRGCKEVRVIQWIGISSDEIQRTRPSGKPYIQNRWPLVESDISRADCLAWMRKRGYPQPPRSACVFCPYHSDREWLRLKTEEPAEFARAVAFEKSIQQYEAKAEVRFRGVPFLHADRRPLDSVVFNEDRQLNLFDEECAGICGV